MKRNKLVIGSFSVAAIALTAVILSSASSTEEASYESKGLASLAAPTNPDEAAEWLNARYIDLETGVRITPEKLALLKKQNALMPKSSVIEWMEQGPDNIGGRTRGLLVSKFRTGQVWAGGVSGGLWKSENGANHWYKVENFPGLPYIAAIAEAPNGTVVVATGSQEEAWSGDGLYYTTDNGDSWTAITGTSNYSVGRMVGTPNNNKIYIANTSGLKVWDAGNPGSAPTNAPDVASSQIAYSVAISGDGSVIAAFTDGNELFVSTDGGNSFQSKTGSGAGQIPVNSASRFEVAVSNTKNSSGNYQLYALQTSNSAIRNYSVSTDNGQTWETQLSNITNDDNTQTLNIFRSQGGYNVTISVDPTDATRSLIGGIDIWDWKQVSSSPINGGYTKKSLWYAAPQSPIYVHADNHVMAHDANNKLYFGNDGGIGVSLDLGETFYPANRGYNVTQFYGIAFDRNGSVLAGAQDNGTLYNDHSNSTWQEFREVTGGDGFESEISFYNPSILFTTVQFNSLNRSTDGGVTANSFGPNLPGAYTPLGTQGATNPFHSEIFLAEYLDLNSKDSVLFIPTQDYTAGTTIQVPSAASGDTITFVTPIDLSFDDTVFFEPSLTTTDYIVTDTVGPDVSYDLGIYDYTPFVTASNPPVPGDTLEVDGPQGIDTIVVITVTPYDHYFGENSSTGEQVDLRMDTLKTNVAWDTLNVQDPYQSWFMFFTNANGGELWGTRDALRLSNANPKWVRVIDGIGTHPVSPNVDVEFSEDLNNIFVNGINGIKRISGLGDIYSSENDFSIRASLDQTPEQVITTISNASFEGIGLDPRNPDELVAVQGFSGSVFRSSNATSASPTLTNVGSQGGIAYYDVIMDRDDNDLLVAGTAFGVRVSENGGATWTDCSAGFENTPVYEVRQSWRTWDEGNFKPGAIFIATFGRGAWSSESVASLIENANAEKVENFKPNMNIYPNPMMDNGTIAFDMATEGNVNINIYNLSGQLVKTIQKTNVGKGQNNVQFNSSDLPRGTYIVKFVGGTSKDTGKFIKM